MIFYGGHSALQQSTYSRRRLTRHGGRFKEITILDTRKSRKTKQDRRCRQFRTASQRISTAKTQNDKEENLAKSNQSRDHFLTPSPLRVFD